ncbi:MAG: proline--tRNA ligase [Actinomycetota bacterium]|nr:MAG: proline--tRNA ligase [Actinomycetota bacterium]
MRMTRLALKTQREAPADAEAVSHQLLVRAGYIRRLASGVYSFLPLGLRVMAKLNQIVREEFDAAGAQELLLPALHPVELWEQTGRLQTMSDVLMTVEAKGGTFVLGPTHEEAVIATISPDLESYRDLPVTVYQIQTKFRDEARPRFGLMRTREFIMADAYSFDASASGMKSSYSRMYQAYLNIFDRCGLPYVPVEADSGAIGGDVNHEFMVPSPIGEDHFAQCPNCGYAANIEAAKRGEAAGKPSDANAPEMTMHSTPGSTTISEVVEALGSQGIEVDSSSLLKSLAFKDANDDVTLILVPGDREVKVPKGLAPLTDNDFESNSFLFKGYIGPMGMSDQGVRVLADYSILERSAWSAGANLVGHHVSNAVLGRDFEVDEFGSFVVVGDGDPCPNCGDALSLVRSIEAGHTFELGLSYSNKISSATFKAEDGTDQKYWMGCYGIGMSRLPAVIAEHFHDADGLRWPKSVAPYQVELLTITPARAPEAVAFTDDIYGQLRERGVEVLYDDRDLTPGVKFADADLIGVPIIAIIGQRGIANGVIEVKKRLTGERIEVSVPDIVDYLSESG